MKLVVEDGSFAYVKGHPIIQDLNFKAESGNLIAILGPNGAGKTTLLRCIMGLLKWDGGRSTLDGQNIYQIPSKKLWQKVSYVPQARGGLCFLYGRGHDFTRLYQSDRYFFNSAPIGAGFSP